MCKCQADYTEILYNHLGRQLTLTVLDAIGYDNCLTKQRATCTYEYVHVYVHPLNGECLSFRYRYMINAITFTMMFYNVPRRCRYV